MSRATLCFSMYSLMSMRIIACSSSKRNSASARASSVLPTPVGPRKMNEPMGRFGSCKPARARRTAFDDGGDRLLLADDARAEALFHLDELLALAFAQIGDGNAGPRADDFGDVLVGDFLACSIGCAAALHRGELGVVRVELRARASGMRPYWISLAFGQVAACAGPARVRCFSCFELLLQLALTRR